MSAEVANSGIAAILFAVLGAGWTLFLERRNSKSMVPSGFWMKRSQRIWNWGLVAVVGVGGIIALIVSAIKANSGPDF
jgi:hypothetical protein